MFLPCYRPGLAIDINAERQYKTGLCFFMFVRLDFASYVIWHVQNLDHSSHNGQHPL